MRAAGLDLETAIFDLVAVDADASGVGATWLSWSPGGGKVTNGNRLGDLELLPYAQTLERMGLPLTWMGPDAAQRHVNETHEAMKKYKPLVDAAKTR